MTEPYRIFGAELSPYSVKVRAYFRYKGLPFEWIVRNAASMEEFRRYAKLPLIPLVVTPEGVGLQDSTPIIEQLESRRPEPSIVPDDPAPAFLSALIEEFADEWVNKPMFHHRWSHAADRAATAQKIAEMQFPDRPPAELGPVAAQVAERMTGRLGLVGSSPENAAQIEAALERLLQLLEAHLARRPFLFGGRPALGDFGLAMQLYECSVDPTPGALIRDGFPTVLGWVERMLAPEATDGWEPLAALEPTLEPLLAEQVAGLFLPWSAANAAALAAGEDSFTVPLPMGPFRQATQKYHARSLAALREKYAAVAGNTALDGLLARTGCLDWLRAA